MTDAATSEAARLRVMAARIIAQRTWPYLSTMLFTLRLVESHAAEVATMAVDSKWRLYYNADFVMECTPVELATVLLHECLHCVMSHAGRFASVSLAAGDLDSDEDVRYRHEVWNIAGDCSINHILEESALAFPATANGVRYRQFAHLGVAVGETTEGTYTKLLGHARPNMDAQDCGSASGGEPRAYELPAGDLDAPGTTELERERVRDLVATDVATARESGDVPQGLARWASDYLDPKVDWRRVLSVRLRQSLANVAGRRDYSFARPSRRQGALSAAGSAVILPTMRQPAPPRVAIVADTSGSIGVDQLNTYVAEIRAIARAVGLSQGMTVIPCDAQAYAPIRLRSTATIEHINFQGGGGTNMVAGITSALKLRPAPHIVVVLTDGHTPWPPRNPNSTVHYIALITSDGEVRAIPPWMTIVIAQD